MSDIFQEVEEEYRREQLAQLWRKYRVPAIGAALLLVGGVAAYQGWTHWRTEQAGAASKAYDAAVRTVLGDNPMAAEPALKDLSEKGVGGYALLSQFQLASLKAKMGRSDEAVKLFDGIAARTSDPLFRDLAVVRSALLTVETGSLEASAKKLEPVAKGAGPWRLLALELLAYANWRGGKKDEALQLYKQVQDAPGVPLALKRRATEMSSLIRSGMTLDDVKKMMAAPADGAASSLLPDVPASAEGLLGPEGMPALPLPAAPSPDLPAPVMPAQPGKP